MNFVSEMFIREERSDRFSIELHQRSHGKSKSKPAEIKRPMLVGARSPIFPGRSKGREKKDRSMM